MTKYLTTAQVARHCGVTQETVTNWIKRGKLSGFSTGGGHFRIPVVAFEKYCKDNGIPSLYDNEPVVITKRELSVIHQAIMSLRDTYTQEALELELEAEAEIAMQRAQMYDSILVKLNTSISRVVVGPRWEGDHQGGGIECDVVPFVIDQSPSSHDQ